MLIPARGGVRSSSRTSPDLVIERDRRLVPGHRSAAVAVSADGGDWGAFGPSCSNGVGDTDLLLTRTIEPIATTAHVLLPVAGGRRRSSERCRRRARHPLSMIVWRPVGRRIEERPAGGSPDQAAKSIVQ
jgi:hypothetical protein